MIFCAYADEEETKPITYIPLSISWDSAPKGGEIVGEIYANTTSSQFIVDGAEYVKKDDTWDYGEQPVAEIELSAEDGYYFNDVSRSRFSISGCSAQFKTAEKDSDGSSVVLQVYLSQIGGSLPDTTSVSWSGKSASWDAVTGAGRYEVKLYRDGQLLTTVTATENSYDFSSYINLEGTYTFAVRAAGSGSTQSSAWVTDSEGLILSRESAWLIAGGTWKSTGSKWRYLYSNNVYPTSAWRLIGEDWYYFDSDGYMVTDCYVKSVDTATYYWIGADGIWDTSWDTEQPDLTTYRSY
jgi:hypothetical protein